MVNTSRARRATALTATAVAVVGTVVVTVAQPSAAVTSMSNLLAVASTAPAVTALSPSVGLIEGGTPVVLTGAGFKTLDTGDPGAVLFGDVPAARITVLSDTKAVVISPPGTGTVPIKLTGSGGAGRGTVRFGYRMALGAEFDTLPARATGGEQVTVTVTGGTVGDTAAAFGALKIGARVGGVAAKVVYVDAQHVKVVLPAAGAAAPASLQLVHDGYTGPESTAKVEYFPVLTAVNPAAVSTEGGATVTITGAGFLNVNEDEPGSVTIGDQPATSFAVVSATRIDAVVPAAPAGDAPVRITTPGGVSSETGAPRVSYRAALAVDPAGDQFLRATGGAHVLAVTGGTLGETAKEFAASGISLRMGATKVVASYVDPTHLKITLPAPATSSAALTVVNGPVSGETVTLPVAPVVTGLTAGSDTVAGGKVVQVKLAGAGVAEATGFTFGANPATCTRTGTGATVTFRCIAPPASSAGPVWVGFTSGDGTASRFTAAATFSYTDLD